MGQRNDAILIVRGGSATIVLHNLFGLNIHNDLPRPTYVMPIPTIASKHLLILHAIPVQRSFMPVIFTLFHILHIVLTVLLYI